MGAGLEENRINLIHRERIFRYAIGVQSFRYGFITLALYSVTGFKWGKTRYGKLAE